MTGASLKSPSVAGSTSLTLSADVDRDRGHLREPAWPMSHSPAPKDQNARHTRGKETERRELGHLRDGDSKRGGVECSVLALAIAEHDKSQRLSGKKRDRTSKCASPVPENGSAMFAALADEMVAANRGMLGSAP